MLSKCESQLIQRDPTIRGLRTCLDLDIAELQLREFQPEIIPNTLRCHYIRYKPGQNCLFGYQARTADGPIWISAKAFADREGTKWDKVTHSIKSASALLHAIPSTRVYFALFPWDGKIAGCRSQQGMHSACARVLREIDCESANLMWVRYKPERRIVGFVWPSQDRTPNLRDEVPSTGEMRPSSVVRFYSPEGYAAAARRWKTALPEVGFVAPRRLANCQSVAGLATEWIAGQTLSSSSPTFEQTLNNLVPELCAGLVRLHHPSEADLPVRSPEVVAHQLAQLAEDLVMVVPHLKTRIQDLFSTVQNQIVTYRWPYVLTHGDLHLGQILKTSSAGIGLLDWDELQHGEPASDLANLLAHVYLSGIEQQIDMHIGDRLAEQIVDEYNRMGVAIPFNRWRHAVAVSLCQLAMQPFRQRLSRWEEKIEMILQLAESQLQPKHLAGKPLSARFPRAIHRPEISPALASDLNTLALNPLEPQSIEAAIMSELSPPSCFQRQPILKQIRVLRHKPQRRALVTYEWQSQDESGNPDPFLTIGKIRFRGLRRSSYSAQAWLAAQGYVLNQDATNQLPLGRRFQVPRVFGAVPSAGMWLQEYRNGMTLTALLKPGLAGELPVRIAKALADLHRSDFPCDRVQDVTSELEVLEKFSQTVRTQEPALEGRLDELLAACLEVSVGLRGRPLASIHRDFYPAQVLIDGPHTVFVDFDLACRGDPALDVGNCIAHVMEHALRHFHAINALDDFCQTFTAEYVQVGGVDEAIIRNYTFLSLARLAMLSRILPNRTQTTETLWGKCREYMADCGAKTSSVV